ncbi:MAG: radical SAM protein [Candidatus Krumholzibacteriales bacterium]
MAENVFVGYPSTYSAGMTNLGYHFLFKGLRSNPYIRAERFFTDTAPFTLESGSRISSARVIFFSVSYEEDYLNMVRILEKSGIPASREERERNTLVIAGGNAPSANPFPVSEIADVICVGEGEGVLSAISGALAETVSEGPDILVRKIAGLDGIFVPGSSPERITFSHPDGIEEFPSSFALSPDTAFGDMMLIETGRGCPGNCTFCLAGSLYNPLRMISLKRFTGQLSRVDGFPESVRKAGLVSTAVAANPDFEGMVDYLLDNGIAPSFSSFRAQDIDEGVAGIIARAEIRSVALAPESGSERARFGLNKPVDDETFFRAAALLSAGGVRRFVIYLLTGYPGEDEAVIDETSVFMNKFRGAAGGAGIEVHINAVVPKPWTPLQFYPLPSESELLRRADRVAGACRKYAGVKIKSVRNSLRQAILSLGTEQVGKAVLECGTGKATWQKALKKHGVDPSFIHVERPGGVWHRIEGPVTEEALRDRYMKLR